MRFRPEIGKVGKPIRTLGLMTGTSMDGLDIAVADIDLSLEYLSYELVETGFIPYSDTLRNQIENALEAGTRAVCTVNYDWGRWVAEALQQFVHSHAVSGIDLVGSHGQTLYHISGHSTLQIGETAFLAQALGVPVVSDFRAADIAAGGTGAPLLPWVDQLLFSQAEQGKILLNIGGVANVSIVPAKTSPLPLLGFDTGPGMALLDIYFQRQTGRRYDPDGQSAVTGRANFDLIAKWLSHPFISGNAPKSTGRDVFGKDWIEEHLHELSQLHFCDALASLAEFTAAAIFTNIEKYIIDYAVDEMYLSGGGLYHQAVINSLNRYLSHGPESTLSCKLIPFNVMEPDIKEAFAMAVYANAHIRRIPVDLRSVTGAKHLYIPGKCQWPT